MYDLELINYEVASAAGAIEVGCAAMDGGIFVVFSFSALVSITILHLKSSCRLLVWRNHLVKSMARYS